MAISGRILAALGAALAIVGAGCAAPSSRDSDALGDWTFAKAVAAPWAPGADVEPEARPLRGARLRFAAGEVVGPAPLGCGGARYEWVVTPAEGLFQGSLPAPQEQAATALGASHLPVLTLRVTCEAGAFDYHLVAQNETLTAIDDMIWTFERDAPAAGPVGTVLGLLAEHMTNDMAFTPESVARKRGFLTPGLERAINAYFERPFPADEVPPINGDPFTDSQEYPTGFTLGATAAGGAESVVPVSFTDGGRSRRVDFVLRRDGERWLLDDLRYEGGGTLGELLR